MCLVFVLDAFEGFKETWHLFAIIVQRKNEHVIVSVTFTTTWYTRTTSSREATPFLNRLLSR